MCRIAVCLVSALFLSACSSRLPEEPMKLDGALLTVDNRTPDEWQNVEIWLNNYYRAIVPSIASHSRYQVALGNFTSGYGQRFNFQRAQITDLRLSARRPDGAAVELKKNFQGTPLNDALGGTR